MSAELPKWPKHEDYATELGYYCAESSAAIARLRVAVEALKQYESIVLIDSCAPRDEVVRAPAHKALAAIGPLPK